MAEQTRIDSTPDWPKAVLESLYSVAFSTPDREVGGVLVGTPAQPGQPPQIVALIPVTQSHQVGGAALLGHDAWVYIHETMGRYYRGYEMIGWFVSRPGIGTEPIDADRATHRQWFNQPFQVLLIFDSQTHQGAVYGWGPEQQLTWIQGGPIPRRYLRPPRKKAPLAALTLLILIGVILGAAAFVLAEGLH